MTSPSHHSNNKILVTGASGFIGQHVCQALAQEQIHVIALSRQKLESNSAVEQYQLDLRNKLHVSDVIRQTNPDIVIHLASSKSRCTQASEYALSYEDNLFSSIHLIEACHQLPALKRFIFLGSCEEYGVQLAPFEENKREMPVTAYGVSKLAVTHYLQSLAYANTFPAVILRASLVYGPGQGTDMFLPALIQSLLSNQPFLMSKGEQTRDYLYIDDLVSAIFSAILTKNPLSGQVINISSGTSIRLLDLALKTAKLIGYHTEQLLNIGAIPYRQGEAMTYSVSNQRAQDLLNWQPNVSLETGLKKTIQSIEKT